MVLSNKNYRRPLTTKFLESLKPKEEAYRVTDQMCENLGVTVYPSGRMTFNWRGRVAGRLVTRTLGTFPLYSLADAREWAREIHQARDRGIDLVAKRQEEEDRARVLDSRTVDWAFRLYMVNEGEGTKTATRRWQMYRRDIEPVIGSLSLYAIGHDDLANILQAKVRTAPIASNRLQSQICRFFRWCAIEGRHLTGLQINPAANLVKLAKAKSRSRFLDDYELGLLQFALAGMDTPFAGPIMFILYTAARRAEVFEMPWKELHEADGEMTWIIPPARTKNGREHILPLPAAAVALLRSIARARGSELVWPSYADPSRAMSGFSKIVRSVRVRMEELARRDGREIEHWTLHDLRRSVASGMNGLHDATGYSLIHETVVERILNHTPEGMKGVYNRWKYRAEKKAALELWAAHLADLREQRAGKSG